jgi:acyl carrier protein
MTNVRQTEIARDVKAYILSTFLPGEDPAALGDATPLIGSGVLDSLATLDVVTFLEKRYGIELEARDTDPSRIGTIADIARLVDAKLGAQPARGTT